jgi:integrase
MTGKIMDNTRHKTSYPGVFYRTRQRIGGTGTEKVYYAVFKRDGKVVETVVGRQYRDNMTPAKASTLRGMMIEGKAKTKSEVRAEKAVKVWTIANLWEEYKTQRHMTKSLNTDDNRFKNYVLATLGKKEPRELVPLDIDRLRIKLLKTKSPQTTKHVIGIIKRICHFGVNKGLCPGLTFRPQMPKVDNRVTEDLTPDQLRALLEAIEADENRQIATMMKMALCTGMRRGELFRLKWQDIDHHRGFIRITESKGGKAQEIPLNSMAKELLSGLDHNSDYVFPGEGGKQRVSVQGASRRIRQRAGLPKSFRPLHGLRHVFASQLASSGQVDMYVLQRLLTHKSPVMTQRYAHLRDAALKQASALAGDIISEATKKQSEANSAV